MRMNPQALAALAAGLILLFLVLSSLGDRIESGHADTDAPACISNVRAC